MEQLRPRDPDRVGAYQLLARLGAGGMGVVYLGRSPGGRAVAVKVVRERFASDSQYRARFRREVSAAREVTGTFTAPVLDADPEAAAPWLVTAYLPGLSLRKAVEAFGGIPPAAVRALAAGLAEALADIHAVGVVHRDLKPENVMLTAGGPRVIDFGVARPEDATAITGVGRPIGTPGFMSPEQVSGDGVGPASDLFALGAVLAYAATGTEPYGSGSTQSKQYRVVTGQADLGGVTDRWLYELIVACQHRDPEHRPPATEVLERLASPAEDELSLQGTGWLPAPLAEAVDRHAAEARQLPESPMARPGPPVTGHAAAEPAVMGGATVEPAAADPADASEAGAHAGVRATRVASLVLSRRALAGAGVVGVGLLAVGGVRALWPSRGSNPSTAGSPTPSGSPTGPPPPATLRWKERVSNYYPDLDLAGGMVLAWGDDDVRAMDPRTGRVRWKHDIEVSSGVGGSTDSTGTVADDVVYSVAPDGRLSALAAATGDTRWTYRPSPGHYPGPGPVVTGSVACFGHYDTRRVTALGVDDGRPRWTAEVSAEHGIAAGAGLVAAVGSELVGLDADSGRTRWTYAIDQGAYPHVGYGLVFLCDRFGTLHAVRADDGKPAWRRPDSGTSFLLQLGDGLLYVAASGGNVLALRVATGERVWSRRLGHGEGAPYGRSNALGLSGGTLYVGCTNRKVYALSAASGRVRWTYGADMTLTSGPVSAAGLVFVGTRDGYVRALDPPAGASSERGGTHAGS